jgi:hypothetical protein
MAVVFLVLKAVNVPWIMASLIFVLKAVQCAETIQQLAQETAIAKLAHGAGKTLIVILVVL